jgi:nicotinamidase-related amidase
MRMVPRANSSAAALLLIDVINDLEFEGSREIFEQAMPMAKNLAELKRRARRSGIPAIYVNEQFRSVEIRLPQHRRALYG